MKKRRLFLIFSILCIIFVLGIFSSQIFKLKDVEIKFFDSNNRVVEIKNNSVFNTDDKINNIISSTSFDYGNLIFLINKTSYKTSLEAKNPYFKLKNIEILFPNKLLITAYERMPVFFISFNDYAFILDEEYKILEKTSLQEKKLQSLIEISIENSAFEKIDFFSFFGILPSSFEAGQNLKENNLIFQAISNLFLPLSNYFGKNSLNTYLKSIKLVENTKGKVDLKLFTYTSPYGIILKIENILSSFDKKLNKILSALKTLKQKELIKCSYGELKVDGNLNCYWSDASKTNL